MRVFAVSVRAVTRQVAKESIMCCASASRLKVAAVLVVGTVAAGGCASSHMKPFIGKDVRYVVIEDGIPANVFDLPDGLRAFQFRWGGGRIYVPKTTTANGQLQVVGNQAWYTEQKPALHRVHTHSRRWGM
jgi:hypothetical protein